MALNMLVSTSFPAEPLPICRPDNSSISGATAREPPVLAPEELGPSHWDAPTQPSTGGERVAREKKTLTAPCFQLDLGVLRGQAEVSTATPSPELQKRPHEWGDYFLAALCSSPSILRANPKHRGLRLPLALSIPLCMARAGKAELKPQPHSAGYTLPAAQHYEPAAAHCTWPGWTPSA